MAGETDLHKTLKKEACRWLFRSGYRCIAAEVRLRPLGIIDAVGTGIFRAWHNYLHLPREVGQTCFVECKASRADFLRDHSRDGQMTLCLLERGRNLRQRRRGRRRGAPTARAGRPFHGERESAKRWDDAPAWGLRQSVGMGKFKSCLLQPMANLHYILAPTGMIQKKELPPRWGLLSYGASGVHVVVRADWQESARMEYVESAVARTLTGDIYRADDRALNSVNREIFAQQQQLADRIRSIRPRMILAPRDARDEPEESSGEEEMAEAG